MWRPVCLCAAVLVCTLSVSVAHSQSPRTGTVRVDGRGNVFLPDPLTRARAVYGDPGFVDGEDADTPQLTAQLVTVPLRDLTFDGTTYSLVGPWAEIVEQYPPAEGPYTSTMPDFLFTRSDQMFEAVNAYYHVDRFMRYLNDTLGVSVRPYQYEGGVRIDPHATTASFAFYDRGVLALGEGNVDKGEDPDVIIHELGHGIHDWLTLGNLPPVNALMEGTADYWANSYNRSYGRWTPEDEQYYWIFHWTSHNENGPGRFSNDDGIYPDSLRGGLAFHLDGQILLSALMQVWDQIGRRATDRNVLAALALTTFEDDQEDFARAFVEADRVVHDGRHLGVIVPILEARGYDLAPTGTEPAPASLSALTLHPPYPNPTRGTVAIRVSTSLPQRVRVAVSDLLGRTVSVLYEGPLQANEGKTAPFDGRAVPAGVYVIQATGEHSVAHRRMTVLP